VPTSLSTTQCTLFEADVLETKGETKEKTLKDRKRERERERERGGEHLDQSRVNVRISLKVQQLFPPKLSRKIMRDCTDTQICFPATNKSAITFAVIKIFIVI